ncbi:methylenetetrahydrofolate reductase [NAD(P)H] [Desulfocurvibacter africanus]|uniref:Methylenetetrahydrofolate reductase n=2 Tax=Desulfocurvibacter africanus TaxID=873 RepID=F3YV77_DESAF|nr:methylenetetrahydrofolate reductase [NAD(P)H] [Desulfocurvibacter africanus]EGJ48395.1 5,10-methylenetetrahydrofolate reductase [Desulfocurvibacter africanus subsp. africanus str. Walvis Bay]EMG37920.1 5,10-methylenetetrahydrofolate reductase (NAD(P)) [Desulfocurvibacter africanus PCS]
MRISDLMRKRRPFVSLEFFPPKDQNAWPLFFEEAERLKAAKPLYASVTYGAGGSGQANTLEIAKRLKNEVGIEPLVHLTCVGASKEKISEFLTELRKAGIENILALRGDPPKGSCDFVPDNEEFQHASDLITFVRRHFPEFCIGAAGYPSPHPQSPSIEEELKWTKFKIDRGADFILTQLFFDHRLYEDFVTRLRNMGVSVPIIPGVLPIMSLQSIRHILALCGANIPGNLYLDLEKAHEQGGSEAVRRIGIQFATSLSKKLFELGAPGVHLYTLNKADACLEIVDGLKL